MNKLVQLIAAVCVVYLLPLWSRQHAMLSPALILASLGGILLLLVQPAVSVKEIKKNQSSDRHSATMIMLMGALAHVLPVLEWRLRSFPWPTTIQLVGMGILAAGLAFRFYSIRILGRHFTATVQVHEDHALVTSGPYSKIRHPSYLGSLLAIVGHAFLLAAPISAAGAALLMLLVYRRRILLEEAALRHKLGDTYNQYALRTSRLVPHMW